MYIVDAHNAQLILGYDDIFKDDKPNLIDAIRGLNMHKAISIISELIQIRNAKCSPINIYNFQITFPFETILKQKLCGIDPQSPEEFQNCELLHKNVHVISLQMLLILLKKILIYGDYTSFSDTEYSVSLADYQEIIKLQLLVADEVESAIHDVDFDSDHFLYSSYHLNYQRNVANEFERMFYMLEVVCKNPACLNADIQREYRDYYHDFETKYGVTPTEYSSFLFGELQYYYSEKNSLSMTGLWRESDLIYKTSFNCTKIGKVISLLKREPSVYREWARDNEHNEWDFTKFMEYPFISDTQARYISISEVGLINAFFEKLFWLIRDCYPIEDSRAMSFFGRLFEKYIQNATSDACCSGTYSFIPEFTFNQNHKSSDAHIKRGSKLLAIEAKGFSVLVDCMSKNENIERNNDKLFVNPVLQADRFLCDAINNCPELDGIDSVYIISVTLDNINAVPKYYNDIHADINSRKSCEQIECFFNLSIEEYEMLLYVIEQGNDVFPLLKQYFDNTALVPFGNYLRESFPELKMTSFMQRNYVAATNEMKSLLWREDN